jgi:hypothetical protein
VRSYHDQRAPGHHHQTEKNPWEGLLCLSASVAIVWDGTRRALAAWPLYYSWRARASFRCAHLLIPLLQVLYFAHAVGGGRRTPPPQLPPPRIHHGRRVRHWGSAGGWSSRDEKGARCLIKVIKKARCKAHCGSAYVRSALCVGRGEVDTAHDAANDATPYG